jgi:hypothetical protein
MIFTGVAMLVVLVLGVVTVFAGLATITLYERFLRR